METSVIGGKRKLRSLELNAYGSVVDALRAQGPLTKCKQEVLKNLAAALNVSEQRGRSEIRRAVNDETLTSIARTINGYETEYAWRIESMRKIPFVPMVAAENDYTFFADKIARIVSKYNEELANDQTPTPSVEEIRKANIQANVEEMGEKQVFNSFLSGINFDEEALSKELEDIEYYSYNQFTYPEEYRKMINYPANSVTEFIEPALPREQSGRSSKILEPSLQPSASCENTALSSSAKGVQVNSSVEVISREKMTETKSAKEIPSNVPSKRGKGQKNSILPCVTEEPTRMVRKAKLNAKRWNPKTQTLESPSDRINANDDNNIRECDPQKTRLPVRNKTSKRKERPKIILVEGDAPQKTVCSTKRGRQATRWSWSRKRRRRMNKVNSDNTVSENSSELLANCVQEANEVITVYDLEENSKKTTPSTNDELIPPSTKPKNRSRLPESKQDALNRNEWLQKLNLVPTSRPINILRKRVYMGGLQLVESKKFCDASPSIEVTQNIRAEEKDSLHRLETTNKDLKDDSSTKQEESIENPTTEVLREISSTESMEVAHSLLSMNSLNDETNSNSVMEVEELVASSSMNTSSTNSSEERIILIPITTMNVDEVVSHSTTVVREEEMNCDPAIKSENVIHDSIVNISPKENMKTESAVNKPERSLLSSYPAKVIIAKSPQKLGRVKILPAGCGKTISQLLLGSKVRVRNRKSYPGDFVSLKVRSMSEFENLNSAESKSVDIPDLNKNSVLVNELTPNTCDDDVRSCSPKSTVLECQRSDEVIIVADDIVPAKLNSPDGGPESSEPQISSNLSPQLISPDSDVISDSSNQKNEDVMDTISEINEDWEDSDSVIVEHVHDSQPDDEKNEVDEVIEEAVISKSVSARPEIDHTLSSMIGIPPWAPKVIKANTIPGTMCCLLSSNSLQTYVPKNNGESISICVTNATLSGPENSKTLVDDADVKANNAVREELSPTS